MKKLLFAVFLLIPSLVNAFDFEVDGLGYNIISLSNQSVYVSQITNSGNIVIPDQVYYNNLWFSVDSISSFFDAPKTQSIKFNSKVDIDGNRLYGCGTAYFYVDENNPFLTSEDGVLYSKDKKRLISYPPRKYEETFNIPNSVERIDEYSFGANVYLRNLYFNDNISELPENFIYGTNYSGDIKYIKLSDKIKVIYGRCLDLWSLETIILPKELEAVEKDFHYDYFGLPNNLIDVTIYNSNIVNYKYVNSDINLFSRLDKLKTLRVLDNDPIEISDDLFSDGQYFTLNLIVPKGMKHKYQSLKGWSNFYNIYEEETESSAKEKCESPQISYKDGKLNITSETPDAICVTTIKDNDVKTHYDSSIELSLTYVISSYATAPNFENSEVSEAILCFLNTDDDASINEVYNNLSVPVIISSKNGFIFINGIETEQTIQVIDMQGIIHSNVITSDKHVIINPNLKHGEIAIVKIGSYSTKLIIH